MLYLINLFFLFNKSASTPYTEVSFPKQAIVSIGKVEWTEEELKSELHNFIEIYKKKPIQDNFGGMTSTHAYYTYFITKKLNPKYIIESGVFKGFSTWLFEQAAPNAIIISIDPLLNQRIYISPNVIYQTKDFGITDWSNIDKENTLCFFDDHYGVDRIFECKKLGFKHIIYEDNYPTVGGNGFNPKRPGAPSIKAAFAFDSNDSKELYNIIQTYYEFPPIVPNETNKRFNYYLWKHVTPKPLFQTNETLFLEIYQNEAWGYTWIAYIKL